MKKKKKPQSRSKCFLTFMYYISFLMIDKLFYVFYILRKKRYLKNFGFFLPKITNISFKDLLYKNLISLNMSIPEDLSVDFIRSRFGRKYFKIFFYFFYGLNFFYKYFNYFFHQIKILMKIKIKNRFIVKKNSRYFLRFLEFSKFDYHINDFQKTFNFFLCNNLSKRMLSK